MRRTAHIDHVRDRGAKGTASITAAARELRTGYDGTASVTGEVRLWGTAEAKTNALLALATAPADPRLAALIGQRLGGGFRTKLTELLPDDVRRSSLLHLLLDDLPGANMVSGYSLQRDNAEHSTEMELTVERLSAMVDVCAGWAADATLLTGIREDSMLPTPIGPAAPDLAHPGDPLAWHEMPSQLPAHGMRRLRRIDLMPLGGDRRTAGFEAHFRDSYFSPFGAAGARVALADVRHDVLAESVLHEYSVNGTVELATGTLTSVHSEAHVLPWRECTDALEGNDRIPGMTLGELRSRVRAELTGTGSCTHLNDVFRSLADLEAMAQRLLGSPSGR